MKDVRLLFAETLAIPDAVQRAQAMCDLAFDAEHMASSDRRAEAIELFELISTLDRFDDLLLPAIESADKYLVMLGAKKQASLDRLLQELHTKFHDLDDHRRLLAVAKTVVREQGKRGREVWQRAQDLLAAAEEIQPLNAKDLRFRAEVSQHLG